MVPHGMPSPAYVIMPQLLGVPDGPPQRSPRLPSQPGIVPPHAAPAVVSAAWHVPAIPMFALSPVHDRPLPHGWFASHVPPISTRSSHRDVPATQDWPWAQLELVQSLPAAGAGAQVPQVVA